MAQTTYQVILSTDGKHTVLGTTDDPTKAKAVFGWVKATYDRVVEVYGLKYEQYQKANGNHDSVPVCAVHQVPMERVQGKHGAFWSCHQRTPDGSSCSYRPNGK